MKRPPSWCRPLSAGVMAVSLLSLLGCSSSKAGDEPAPGPAETATGKAAPAGTVVLSQAQVDAAGIRVAALASSRHQDQTEAWGRVLPAQDLAGSRQALASASAAVSAAKAQDEQARKEYKRLEGLYAQDATASQKSLEAARSAAEASRAAVASAEASLASQRAVAMQDWGAGLAADLERGGGAAADLLALRAVPVLVTAGSGEPGVPPQRALVRSGEKVLEATLLSVVRRTEGVLQGPGCLYSVKVEGAALAAGQNVEVLLPSGPERDGVEVPREAGVWWKGALWVYLQEAPGRFRRTPLEGPVATPDGWFVASGLKPGDQLVVSGAQVLFSEEMKALTPSADED